MKPSYAVICFCLSASCMPYFWMSMRFEINFLIVITGRPAIYMLLIKVYICISYQFDMNFVKLPCSLLL